MNQCQKQLTGGVNHPTLQVGRLAETYEPDFLLISPIHKPCRNCLLLCFSTQGISLPRFWSLVWPSAAWRVFHLHISKILPSGTQWLLVIPNYCCWTSNLTARSCLSVPGTVVCHGRSDTRRVSGRQRWPVSWRRLQRSFDDELLEFHPVISHTCHTCLWKGCCNLEMTWMICLISSQDHL